MYLSVKQQPVHGHDICQHTYDALQPFAEGYGNKEHGYHHEIRVCPECDLGITFPVRTNLASLYESRTSTDFSTDDSNLAARLKDLDFSWMARTWLKKITIKPKTVLDIGCGDGRFTLALAKQLGRSVSVYGTDFHGSPPPALAGQAFASYLPLADIACLRGACDLLIMRHSLEHANDPVEMLASLRPLLRKNGQIIIEVPNRRSPWGKLLGKYFEMWYVPYHRVHFSQRSLKHTLERAQFKVLSQSGVEAPNMGRSLRNMLDIKYNGFLFVIGAILQPIQFAVSYVAREPIALIACAARDDD